MKHADIKERIVIAMDFDNTMVQFAATKKSVVYTGFSIPRWQSFFRALQLGLNQQGYTVIFVGVTAKFIDDEQEAYEDEESAIVLAEDYLKSDLDCIGDSILTNFSTVILESHAYYTQGRKKSIALAQIADRFEVLPSQIYLLDDNIKVIQEISSKGYKSFIVPATMYELKFKEWEREAACIEFMLYVLTTFKCNLKTSSPLYATLTQRLYPDPTKTIYSSSFISSTTISKESKKYIGKRKELSSPPIRTRRLKTEFQFSLNEPPTNSLKEYLPTIKEEATSTLFSDFWGRPINKSKDEDTLTVSKEVKQALKESSKDPLFTW